MLLHFGLSAIHPSSSSRFKFNHIILMHHLGAHCPWPPQPQFQEGRCTPYYIPAPDDTRVGATRLFHSRCPVNATPQLCLAQLQGPEKVTEPCSRSVCCFILKGVPVILKELVFLRLRETYLSFIIKLVECKR